MFQETHLSKVGTELSADERKLSRRELLIGAAGGLLAVGMGVGLPVAVDRRIGVSFNNPPLDIKETVVIRDGDEIRLYSKTVSEDDGRMSVLSLTPESKLLFEPFGESFTAGEAINYVHRGGNNFASIDESCRKYVEEDRQGLLALDIDVTTTSGVALGEHGILYQPKIRLLGRRVLNLPSFVIDVDEKEVRLGEPDKYEELIAYMAHIRNTYGIPLVGSAELKRGKYDLHSLHFMYGVHRRHKVPGWLHSPKPGQFDDIQRELATS